MASQPHLDHNLTSSGYMERHQGAVSSSEHCVSSCGADGGGGASALLSLATPTVTSAVATSSGDKTNCHLSLPSAHLCELTSLMVPGPHEPHHHHHHHHNNHHGHHHHHHHIMTHHEDMYKMVGQQDGNICMSQAQQQPDLLTSQASRDPWATSDPQHPVLILTSTDIKVDGKETSVGHAHHLLSAGDSVWASSSHHSAHHTGSSSTLSLHHSQPLSHADFDACPPCPTTVHHQHANQHDHEMTAAGDTDPLAISPHSADFLASVSSAAAAAASSSSTAAISTSSSAAPAEAAAAVAPSSTVCGPSRPTSQRRNGRSVRRKAGSCCVGGGSGSLARKRALDAVSSSTTLSTSAATQGGGEPMRRRNRRNGHLPAESGDPSRLETCAEEVAMRFQLGCECTDDSCFRSLNPASVFQHRLNIAELSRHEHDMYLMGVTMACLLNPDETARHKERQRQRARYVYRGRDVCLSAFLYLEKCTLYQLKRIRQHVTAHGVTPRRHGNVGKLPHNTLPLHSYQHASRFLHTLIARIRAVATTNVGGGSGARSVSMPDPSTAASGGLTDPSDALPGGGLVAAPPELSRKAVHEAYLRYMSSRAQRGAEKPMSYSLFLQFLRARFPQLRFPRHHSVPPAVLADGGVRVTRVDASLLQEVLQEAADAAPSPSPPALADISSSDDDDDDSNQGEVRLSSDVVASPSQPAPPCQSSPAGHPPPVEQRQQTALTDGKRADSPTVAAAAAAALNHDFGVPLHHETTTYTVSQRPTVVVPLCDYVVEPPPPPHQPVSEYHYSVSI